ncbi:MAG: DNA/RNA nuclease SfsA [Pseudomonadota bacterium]
MDFTHPLVPGKLVRRYKRFLADVELAGGDVVTAHCANPGSMMGLNAAGLKVWLEPAHDPKRKLAYSWRLVEMDGAMAGIDTGVPNKVVGEALRSGKVPELQAYSDVRPEQRYAQASRVDFLLSGDGLPDAYVEVKNVHLMREPGLAEFPDSVTARGTRHLGDLADEVQKGHRAVMFYVIQRDDCDRLDMADDIDPAYANAFDKARARGVEVLAYACKLDQHRITLDHPIPVIRGSG